MCYDIICLKKSINFFFFDYLLVCLNEKVIYTSVAGVKTKSAALHLPKLCNVRHIFNG